MFKYKFLLLTIVLADACANELPDQPEGEITVALSSVHEITFAATADGYQTIVEKSSHNEPPVLERYGAGSASAIYAAVAPNAPMPEFLRHAAETDASLHGNVVTTGQALTGGDFVDLRGACMPETCLRFSDPDYVVRSDACLLDQQGGTYSEGLASTAYARFNARSKPGVASMTFPNGKEITMQVNPDDWIVGRAIGPRGKLGRIEFAINGGTEPDAIYDLYACYTALP